MDYLLSFFILLSALSSSIPISSSEIIRKELRSKEVNLETIAHLNRSVRSAHVDPSHVVQLLWQPRLFLYNDFLSEEECDYLISLEQSANRTFSKHDNSRETITNTRIKNIETPPNMEDDIVSRIEDRVSAWTFLPKENSKALQVMHFGVEDNKDSYNYFENSSMADQNLPLIATVLLYLSNVTRGGQILFPKSELKSKTWSDCTSSSNFLKPTKGNAILFFATHLNTTPDTSSYHARCPVLEGEMWYATKYFYLKATTRSKAIKLPSESDDGECTDEDDNCPGWAAMGECKRNPEFMVGSPDYYGTCRKSCNVC